MWYKILAWILKTKTYRHLVRNVLSGWTVRRYGWPTFKGSKYWEIKDALEKSIADKGKGIFVFCSVDLKMVSYIFNHRLTDCKFNHCGIIFKESKTNELYIKHINPLGYLYEPLLDYLGRVDHFYVGRMPLADLKEGQRRLALIEDLIHKPHLNFDYDYSVELEPELIEYVTDPENGLPDNMLNSVKLYCSEFIYLIGYKLVTDEDFKARWFHDRYIFEPDDVYRGTEPLFDV